MEKNPYRGNREWISGRPKPEHLRRLSVTQVEIEDAAGIQSFDQNTAIIAFCNGLADRLTPIETVRSVCSAEPAVIYRTNEAEIPLTPEEARRHVLRALTPEEFFAICDEIGATWEMHDDFYDPDTGEALQPRTRVPWEVGTWLVSVEAQEPDPGETGGGMEP